MTRINASYPPHIKRAVRTGTLTLWGCALLFGLVVGLWYMTGEFSPLLVFLICPAVVVLLVINTRALRTVEQWGRELDNRTTGT